MTLTREPEAGGGPVAPFASALEQLDGGDGGDLQSAFDDINAAKTFHYKMRETIKKGSRRRSRSGGPTRSDCRSRSSGSARTWGKRPRSRR